MSTFTSDRTMWNAQRGLTKDPVYFINGHPLCAPEASAVAGPVLTNPNPKGGES